MHAPPTLLAFNLDANPSIQFAYLQAMFDSESQKAMLIEQGTAGISNFSQRCIEDLETKGSVLLRGVRSNNNIATSSGALGDSHDGVMPACSAHIYSLCF